MGFGTGLPLLLVLGFVVLGPKQMQALLRHVARLKAELRKASGDLKSHLPNELATDDSRVANEQTSDTMTPK